jgi:hypothetical protein
MRQASAKRLDISEAGLLRMRWRRHAGEGRSDSRFGDTKVLEEAVLNFRSIVPAAGSRRSIKRFTAATFAE